MSRLSVKSYVHVSYAMYLFFAIICVAVYFPIFSNGFLYHWDDQWMVLNKYTDGGWTVDNLWHIFTDFYGGQYGPFTELNYLIIYTFFGYDPFYFHLASLLWHIGCVCFVWKLLVSLLRIHGGMNEKSIYLISFITTLLFAIHPMNVEPVAWISAVKIPIYAFFYLLGLLCYVHYVSSHKFRYYLFTIVCFVCSFLGKEQAVTFPLALLIVDWFSNRKMKSSEVWSEKIVFFIMALFFGLITIFSQGISQNDTIYSLGKRLIFACYAIIEYITKSLIPLKLNYLYPFPFLSDEDIPLKYYLYPIIVCCLLSWVVMYRKNRYIVLGILLFFLNLIVSIHILPMSRHAIIADRYLYLSYVGIAFLIAYGIHIVWEKHKKRHQCLACIFLLIYSLYFSTYTYLYAQKWENTSSVKKYIKELIEQRDKEKEIK